MNQLCARLLSLLVPALISLGSTHGLAAAPTITSFTPGSGVLDSNIIVTGTGFIAPATVSFNGVPSVAVTVSSSTKLTARVPLTASTGNVTVKTTGGTAISSTSYTVLPGIVPTSSIGSPTSVRTLYYSGFGQGEAVDVYFDSTAVGLSVASSVGAGTITITIPASAYPGLHWLTAIGRHSALATQKSFTVRTDWTAFGFSTNHQSSNPYENVLSPTTVDELDESWETPAIGSMLDTPADVGGTVYAAFNDGSVRAFDEVTGTQKWSYLTGGNFMISSPAISGGIVYIGSNTHANPFTNPFNALVALDAKTGSLKWQFTAGDSISSSPAVSNGIVYFGSYDHKVYALNAATGALIWNFTTGGAVYSSPTVVNGTVYVGSFDQNVYALNASTGAKIWQAATGNIILASPVVAGGLVYIGSEDGKMYAVHASDGTVAWTYTAGGAIDSTVAVLGSTLYFGCNDGKIYSLTAAGALRWSVADSTGAAIRAGVTAANGVIYATDSSYTYAYSTSGTLLTVLPIGTDYGSPIVVNGAVLVGDKYDGILARYTIY